MRYKHLRFHILTVLQFQKNKTISEKDEFYNANPGLADRMHCIVYVVKSVNPNGLLFDKICEKIFKTVGRDYGEQSKYLFSSYMYLKV